MIAVLAVLGVIFLLMFVGFLIHLVYMGSCHNESPAADGAAATQQAGPNQLAANPAPIDLTAHKTITATDQSAKTVKQSVDLSTQTTEKLASSKMNMAAQSPPKSNIPTPVRASSPGGRGRAAKEPILAIVNKSLTSVKSLNSSNTAESSSSKALSTRSSLEVQRKELALRKKKAKPNTTAKTPEAK